jgi:hypothetical protein
VVSQTGSDRGSTLNPAPVSIASDVERQTQTGMRRTEVVHASNQKHALLERRQGTRQGATAACQAGQTLAEGGIQPFDKGRVDAAAAPLRGLNDRLDQGRGRLALPAAQSATDLRCAV